MNPDPIYALILFGEVIHVSDEHVYIVYKRNGDLIETSCLRRTFWTVPKVGDQVAARTTIKNHIDPPPPPFSYPPQQRNVVPLPEPSSDSQGQHERHHLDHLPRISGQNRQRSGGGIVDLGPHTARDH